MRVVRFFFKYLLAAFFILAGLNHFRDPDFYTNIMPDYIPTEARSVANALALFAAVGRLTSAPIRTPAPDRTSA